MDKVTDIHVFAGSKMNLDVEDRFLKPNETREVYNSICSTPGSKGAIKKLKGFENVLSLAINADIALPSASMVCVGTCSDLKTSSIIYFLCDISGNKYHSILRMFTYNKKCEFILRSCALLNFQLNYKVKANTIEDLLYWTDGYEGTPFVDYNPPRKINIVKATAMTNLWDLTHTYYKGMVVGRSGKSYRATTTIIPASPYVGPPNESGWELANVGWYDPTTGITQQIFDRIKYPMTTDLSVTYYSDATVLVNNLRGHLFKFKGVYLYDDNEKTVYSCDSDIPLPKGDELINGNFVDNATINNAIQITFPTGSAEVKRVQICVSEGDAGVWRQIYSLEKYDANGVVLVASDSTASYLFYNNEAGIVLDQTDVNRFYDAIPQISGNETIIERNRIIDAEYKEGFDNTKIDVSLSSSLHHVPDVELELVLNGTFFVDPYTHFEGPYIDIPSNITVNSQIVVNVWRYSYYQLTGINVPPAPPYGDTSGSILLSVTAIYTSTDTPTTMCTKLRNLVNQTMASLYNLPPIQYMAYYTTPSNRLFLKYDTFINFDHVKLLGDQYFVEKLSINILSPTPHITSFKAGSWHLFGLEYFDRAMRRTFVDISDQSKIYLPYFTEGKDPNNPATELNGKYYNIQLNINHIPPMYAEYYRLVYLPGTSFFLDFSVPVASLANDGINSYLMLNDAITKTAQQYAAFNIGGYTWQQGDRIRFVGAQLLEQNDLTYTYFNTVCDYLILGTTYRMYNSSTTVDDDWYLKDQSADTSFILDQDGNKVRDAGKERLVLPFINISANGWPPFTKVNEDGVTVPTDYFLLVEVYRPRKNTADVVETYNEFDHLRPVLNPHTQWRVHSGGQMVDGSGAVLSPAVLNLTRGDCYVKLRVTHGTSFWCEAREYSDYYTSNYINVGRVNVTDPDAQRNEYISKLLYSGAFIQDTNTNDLSKVDSSNSVTLADKYGSINYIQEVGYTLKVLQDKKPTSLPIGRVTFDQAIPGQGTVGATKDVLGPPTVHESDYGTIFTSGCVKHERRLYFVDIYAGLILMDSDNGIHPISLEHEIDYFVKAQCKRFLADGVDNIQVYGGYDEYYNVVFFSFYDSVTPANSFTVSFREGDEETEGFLSFYKFYPEFYGWDKDILTSWKANALWLHNSDNVPLMNFYGVQNAQTIKFTANKDPMAVKDWHGLMVNSDYGYDVPSMSIAPSNTYTRGMFTKLVKANFSQREGRWYSNIPKNMLTHQLVASADDWINGSDMRGASMEIELESATVEDTTLVEVQTTGVVSLGT